MTISNLIKSIALTLILNADLDPGVTLQQIGVMINKKVNYAKKYTRQQKCKVKGLNKFLPYRSHEMLSVAILNYHRKVELRLKSTLLTAFIL